MKLAIFFRYYGFVRYLGQYPMIIVGPGTAWKADDARTDVGQRNGCRCVVLAVPLGRIQAEPARVGRADRLAGVDRKMREAGRRQTAKLDVIQIESRFSRTGGVLNDKPGEIVRVGHAQGRRGRVLLPGIGHRRGQMVTGTFLPTPDCHTSGVVARRWGRRRARN